MCVYFTMKLTEGIMRAVSDSYGSIKGCRCWLSQETAHIHSTVEDLGWGCGYRNIQMMISCLLTHPLYSDHVMSGKMRCVIICFTYWANAYYSILWDTYYTGATEDNREGMGGRYIL